MEIESQKEPSKYDIKHAYKTAEAIERKLRRAVETMIALCNDPKNKEECKSWLEGFFQPALNDLNNKKDSPIRRLSNACIHLQVFGGMGSWTDVCPGDDGNLFESYTEANTFYQECWGEGLK
jgi:hypothetical protein